MDQRNPSRGVRWAHPLRYWFCAVGLLLLATSTVAAQEDRTILRGRLVDRDSGQGIANAEVVLSSDSQRYGPIITSRHGLFDFDLPSAGSYTLVATHVGYGSHSQSIDLPEGQELVLRVTLSPTVIEVAPVVVEVEAQTRTRSRGTAVRVMNAEALRSATRTGTPLISALSETLPGLQVTAERSSPGQPLCIESRRVSTLAEGCRSPAVVVDGVRQSNPLITLNSIIPDDIRSIEFLSPAEAGVLWGGDALNGVLLIETVNPAVFVERTPDGSIAPNFSWSLESEPYPWGKNLITAVVVNGAALLAGRAVADACLSFDDVSAHFYHAECGFFGNTATRLALYVAPPLLTGWSVQKVGRTDLSTGNWWGNAVGSAAMAIPGVILALTSEEEGFSGSRNLGLVMITVASPVLAVGADRLIRTFR